MNRELTKAEIDGLQNDYYNMIQDLKEYRKLIWTKKFWKASKEARTSAFGQYRFIQWSLNELLESLMKAGQIRDDIVVSALRNRFVTCQTKRHILQFLIKNRG